MPKIFISYRREDSSYPAGAIARRLAAVFGKDSVVLDVDNIPAGLDFRDYIKEQLDACDLFLALIGRHWLAARDEAGRSRLANPNDWVRLELETALRRESKVPVIPVLLDNIAPLAVEQLPEGLKDLAYRQAHAVRPPADFDQDLEKLVEKIKLQQKAQRQTPRREAGLNAGGGSGRKWGMAAAVVAAAVLAALGFFLILPGLRLARGPAGDVAMKTAQQPSPHPVSPSAGERDPSPASKPSAGGLSATVGNPKSDEDFVLTPLSEAIDAVAARVAAARPEAMKTHSGPLDVTIGRFADPYEGTLSTTIGLRRALFNALDKRGVGAGNARVKEEILPNDPSPILTVARHPLDALQKSGDLVAYSGSLTVEGLFGRTWLKSGSRKIPIVRIDYGVGKAGDDKVLFETRTEPFERSFAKGPAFVGDPGDIAMLLEATVFCPTSMFGAMPDFPVGDAIGEHSTNYVQFQQTRIVPTDGALGEAAPYAIEVLVADRPADGTDLSKLEYRAVQPELWNGRPLVVTGAGRVFAVRVVNNSSSPAAYRVSMDGLNVFEFSDLKGKTKGDWILAPNSTHTIYGWPRQEAIGTERAAMSDRFAPGGYPDVHLENDQQEAGVQLAAVTVTFRAAWNDGSFTRPGDELDWGTTSLRAQDAVNSAVKIERWHIGLLRAAISVRCAVRRPSSSPVSGAKLPVPGPETEIHLP
jgi:hypothetical protein